jgi:tryptophan halogenase
VRRATAPLTEVLRLPTGEVESLRLANGELIAGELFLDCSGSDSLLMRQIGAVERDDWSAWLPCDRMISARAPLIADFPPFTRTVATDAGWAWRLPLARASVAGYVYSSAFTTDEAALRYLQSAVPGVEAPGRAVSLSAGRRRRFWEKNCVALGASAMQLEPLAGADLHFAQLGLGTLIELFPLDVTGAIEGAEYNRVMTDHADALAISPSRTIAPVARAPVPSGRRRAPCRHRSAWPTGWTCSRPTRAST